MMQRKKKRCRCKASTWLSLLLVAAMLVGSLPLTGFEVKAAEEATEGVTAEKTMAAKTQAASTTSSGFAHPGLLHTEEAFTKMKENVDNNVSPNKETWDTLWWDGFSNPNWDPRPLEYVIRGGTGDSINQLRIDIRRAYQNALIWRISGDEAHGEAACRIINAWTAAMKGLGGNADRFLAAGIQGYELANVGEIMRDHPNFDTEGLQNLLLNVFYPMNDDFMRRHNDAYIGNYWANWELCNVASMISIGVFCDREDIYQQALDYFKNGKGNGSFYHTMPYVFEEEGLVQWQESVRDQGHTNLGIVLCEVICETAWNQGDDLYSLSDNRFLKAVEYTAKYNSLNEEVPSTFYEYRKGTKPDIVWCAGVNPYQRGNWRPMYSLAYNHYVNRKGLEMPNVKQMMDNADGTYIEGASGNSFDEMGWQTLTFANISERVEDEPVQGELTDGVYRICSVSSGKSLVVNEEGNLASAEKGTRKDEWWLIKNKGDGEYTITNMVTGKLMQVNDEGTGTKSIDGTDYTYSRYYLDGTQIGTGDATGSQAQSFAFLKEKNGSFRIVPALTYYVLALEANSTADDARIVQWWNDALNKYAYWNEDNPGQRWTVEKATEVGTEFTFDDESTGFTTTYAQAAGTYTLVEHGDGKAISLNGTSDFLTVTAATDKGVLTGETGFTVSFEAKPEAGTTNWMFYAAPNEDAQTENYETYLGILENSGTITAERYKNNGEKPQSASAETGVDGWYQVSVVYTETETILYINGEEKARQASSYKLTDILGENSILQIGKGNWGTGEYYKGLIDNFKITGHAMTQGEVIAEAADYASVTIPETLIDFTFDDEETGLTGGVAAARGAHSLQEHGDGKALYLNGFKDYLKVTGQDGGTLVPGGMVKELTISLQAKPETGTTNWVFYAAPDTTAPTYKQETYLGVLDNNGTITAQRYDNAGERSPSAETAGQANRWHYLTIVLAETEIVIYDNGEEKTRTTNSTPLSQILGGDSIWQIGKANWGTGEYYRGLIDNYKVLSRAWSAEEVKAEALKYVDKSELQTAVDNAKAEEQSVYTAERWNTYTTALENANAVLSDSQALQSGVDEAASALNCVQAWMRLDEALHVSVDESKESEYTAKTWEPYAAALKTAKEYQAGGTASQSEVDVATKELTETQSGLISKSETISEAISRIDAIGEPQQTPDCSRKIILARETCNLLNEEELALITNLTQLETAEAAMTDYLAEFTFADEETGFIGGQAVAAGTYTIQNGALYLDGSSSNWLNVTKADGSSLLTGRTQLTISFAAKPQTGNSNWVFYAAPDGNAPTANYETYLGLLEKNGTLTGERYKNAGERSAAVSTTVDNSDWYYVTLVYTPEETVLYVNGEEQSREASSVALTDIFGENGILQIGKANWGTGEYYKGLLGNFKILGTAMTADEIKAEAEDYLDSIVEPKKKVLAKFTFDDAEDGCSGGRAVAQVTGTPVFVEDETRGKVLSLDGTGSVWLNVATITGEPLLTGAEELTVSYYSKAERSDTNWAFYAAPNGNAQNLGSEYYIGILEKGGSVTAERFHNGRQPSAEAAYETGWNHIAVVYDGDSTKVYVNGVPTAPAENSESLKEILGENSVLQIGKANWGTGEYYQGLLDDFVIYNYALSEKEIKALKDDFGEVTQPGDPQVLKDKITEASAIQQGNYTEASYQALQEAIAVARAAAELLETREELTAQMEALQAAIDALTEKTDDPDNPENILVESVGITPGTKTLTVGQRFTVTVTVAPENASNKEVILSSSDPKVAQVSGSQIIAKGAGNAVIKAAAADGSGAEAVLTVKVRQKAVATVKAAQQKTSQYVKVTVGKVSGAVGYDIYRSTKAKSGYKKIGTTTKSFYIDKKVKKSKTYYYKVVAKAKTAGCNSVLSTKYAKIKVLARPAIKVKAQTGRKLLVSWKKVKGAKGYVIYTSTKKNKGFQAVKTVKKAKTVKAVITAKKNAKKLYVKVRPYYTQNGKKVYGPYSKTVSVKVKK